MTARRRTGTGVATMLVVLALAMRLLAPSGYMIAADGGLPFKLTLCTAQGAVDLPVPGGEHAPAPHKAPLCAFAFAGAPALVGEPPLAMAVHAYAQTPDGPRAPPLQGVRALAAPPPPATGPPATI